jgi:hypothetical protein
MSKFEHVIKGEMKFPLKFDVLLGLVVNVLWNALETLCAVLDPEVAMGKRELLVAVSMLAVALAWFEVPMANGNTALLAPSRRMLTC